MATPADPARDQALPTEPRSASRPAPALPPATASPTDGRDDWPVQATNSIVNAVDQVRDKTTGPILTAARGLVFGLIIAVLAVIVFVLVIIAVVRVLDELLPWGVWFPYLLLGSAFTIAGAVVFHKRNAAPEPSTAR